MGRARRRVSPNAGLIDWIRSVEMDLSSLIVFLLVGAIAGWLAGQIMKGRGFGLIGNIVVGIVGAFLGGWLLGAMGVSLGVSGLAGVLLQALLGAIVLLALVGLIKQA